MSEELKDQLRNVLPTLLREDESFRAEMYGLLTETFATKSDLKKILEELKRLRSDFNKRFEAFDKRFKAFDKRMQELRNDFNKQFKAFDKRMQELRNDFNKRFEEMDTHLSALGARWGISSERAFRKGLASILEDRFDAKVQKWETYDEEGTVYGHQSVVEIDVVLQDEKPLLIEIKASVKKSDVAELIKIGRLYERKEEVQPDLAVMTPFIREEAKEFALKHGIKLLSASRRS